MFGATFEAEAKRFLSGNFERGLLALAEGRRPLEHELINMELALTDATVGAWLNAYLKLTDTEEGTSSPHSLYNKRERILASFLPCGHTFHGNGCCHLPRSSPPHFHLKNHRRADKRRLTTQLSRPPQTGLDL